MKYIKGYKIFEDAQDEDENDEIPEGFKYSWNDIYESLLYLTDIGFQIDEKSQKRYLADEKGNQIKGEYEGGYGYNREYKSNIELAKNAIYEIRLFKKKESNRLYKSVSLGGYPSREKSYYLDSDIDGLLAIYEEIASFCARFDKAYHNLTIENDGYSVWLVASSDVTGDFITKKLDDELNDKVENKISKQVLDNFDRFSSGNKFYTKKFREDFFGKSLYQQKNGIFIKTFDWNSITKGVYITNSEVFDKAVKSILGNFNNTGSWDLGKYGYKAEFRELKEEDIKGFKEGGWQQETAEKYIGTKAIIVKFDYQKVFDMIKKELSEKKKD
jgi:hypothetical protein